MALDWPYTINHKTEYFWCPQWLLWRAVCWTTSY